MSNQDKSPKMGDAATPLTIKQVLQIKNYRWLWLGQIVSNFGDSLTHFALILLVNKISGGSTGAIAGLLIAIGLPMATIGLAAGVMVDRFPRRRVMILSDIARAIMVIGFILYALLGWESIWILYVVAFLHSAVNSFFMPARSAITPNLVPAEGLLAANSLGQISMVIFRVVGTAAAGFLIGVLNVYWLVFTIDGFTFLLSAFFISQIVLSEEVKAVSGGVSEQLHQLRSELTVGLRALISNKLLAGISVGVAAAMLGLGAINVLLPVIVINELNLAETWFGLIEFSQVAAMIISGLFMTALAARFRPTHIAATSLLFVGLITFFFVSLNHLWQLFPILFAIGLFITPMQAASSTIMQTSTDESMLGRVGSALNAIIQVATLVSMFAAGLLAESLGSRMVFLIGGCIVCTAAVLMALIFRGSEPVHVHEAELQEAIS
ncbi:MAG: DHA3 family macrolide efflux protein-like MFS transporter [Cellvibrionaceae bacterium]|jgi:DHA3 family macrolide efflux protein-like MFS transporter